MFSAVMLALSEGVDYTGGDCKLNWSIRTFESDLAEAGTRTIDGTQISRERRVVWERDPDRPIPTPVALQIRRKSMFKTGR
jgi:hypothetical protein